MKRIYMTIALVGAVVTGAFAQKAVDLALTPIRPMPGATYANLNPGDTFVMGVIVKNAGTVAITPNDTLKLSFAGMYNLNYRISGYDAYGLNIAPGAQDTLGWTTIQNDTVAVDGSTVIRYRWNTNSLDTFFAEIHGVDVNGTPFTDPGAEDLANLGGNNILGFTCTFGTVSGIVDTRKKEGLKLYPNPTNDVLNVELPLDKAEDVHVTISDISGRVIKTEDLGRKQSGIYKYTTNVANLNTGLYLIEISTESKRAINKFNVKK